MDTHISQDNNNPINHTGEDPELCKDCGSEVEYFEGMEFCGYCNKCEVCEEFIEECECSLV